MSAPGAGGGVVLLRADRIFLTTTKSTPAKRAIKITPATMEIQMMRSFSAAAAASRSRAAASSRRASASSEVTEEPADVVPLPVVVEAGTLLLAVPGVAVVIVGAEVGAGVGTKVVGGVGPGVGAAAVPASAVVVGATVAHSP